MISPTLLLHRSRLPSALLLVESLSHRRVSFRSVVENYTNPSTLVGRLGYTALVTVVKCGGTQPAELPWKGDVVSDADEEVRFGRHSGVLIIATWVYRR